MNSITRHIPVFATVCAFGLSIGFVSTPRGGNPPESEPVAQTAGSAAREEENSEVLKSLSADEFADSAVEKQAEWLVRMAQNLDHVPRQTDLLRVVRALSALRFEQGLNLLSAIRGDASFRAMQGGGADLVRVVLMERIAASNADGALEHAQKTDDRLLLGAAVDSIAQRSAADALRAIGRLSGRHQIMGIWFVRGLSAGAFSLEPQDFGGTLEEAVAALKANAGLFLQGQFSGQLRGLLAALAAKGAEDPAAAVFRLRGALRDLFKAQAGGDSKKAEALASQRIGDIAAGMQFGGGSDVAFAIFNALKEQERGDAVAGRVVGALARESGVEAAMRFAEERRVDSVPKELALRAFLAVNREDPKAALQWIETLPSGPLRQGVLFAVAYAAIADATLVDPDAGHSAALMDAGLRLYSEKTKADYFAMLIPSEVVPAGTSAKGVRHGSPLLDVPRTVFIEELTVPEAMKEDLWRQSAPIRQK